MKGFTTVQSKMLQVLADGRFHSAEELHKCLMDDMGSVKNIAVHITALRKLLRPKGENIHCDWNASDRRYYYRHVRIVSIAE